MYVVVSDINSLKIQDAHDEYSSEMYKRQFKMICKIFTDSPDHDVV